MKKCPFCAEEIQSEAKKCKHCGEFLEPEKRQSKSRVGDFSGCRVLKENEGPANVRCPKCGFHGITKEEKGDYNPTIFWLLLIFCAVIGGVLYYHFSTKTKYVCPHCANDYLEVLSQASNQEKPKKTKKSNSNTIGILILIGFIGLMLIVLLGDK